ncbi:MAG: ribosome recycling factor [Bacteroidetes bacterium]|nr:ribosome recycling factor [Bacteroidota bacterium]
MLDPAIKKLIDEADQTMDKAIEHLQIELSGIRAGRATPAMVEHIKVDYYGNATPLNQVASISAPQADLLVVQPWDTSAIGAIEKAIQASSMGMNPSNDGVIVRIPIPPLSEERRRDLVKTAKARGEDAKVAIRNIRRHIKDTIKTVQQDEHLPEDMKFEGEETLQKITDRHTDRIDDMLNRKESEIMEV